MRHIYVGRNFGDRIKGEQNMAIFFLKSLDLASQIKLLYLFPFFSEQNVEENQYYNENLVENRFIRHLDLDLVLIELAHLCSPKCKLA